MYGRGRGVTSRGEKEWNDPADSKGFIGKRQGRELSAELFMKLEIEVGAPPKRG